MSKISLEPNDSGAGTFSIVSPDSNTNRTLNLPDEAGTILSDTSTIDSNNLQSDVYKQNNILGTVSESGGVPTGAIIESGSNSNGEFIKYADGTMICITKKSPLLTTGDGSSVGSLERSNTTSFTYPATFASIDHISGFKVETGNTSGTDFVSLSRSNQDYLTGSFLSTIEFVILTSARSGDVSKVKVMAIGRWY